MRFTMPTKREQTRRTSGYGHNIQMEVNTKQPHVSKHFPSPEKTRTHGTFLQQWEHKASPVSFSYFNGVHSTKTEHEMCQLFLLQQWAVHENRTQSVSAFLTSTAGSPLKQKTKCVSFSYFNSGQSMKTEHKVCQLFLLQQRAVHENRTQSVSAFLTSTAGSP